MKQLLRFTLGLCMLLPSFLFAQKATISGNVTDAKTKEALFGATVRVGDVGASTVDGLYELSVDAGTISVECSYVGYETQTVQITVKAGESKTLDFAIEEIATILNQVTVTSSRFEKPLGEVTVSLDIIKPSLVESVNATSVSQVVDKVPGVQIIDGQANIRGGSGYSYGAGSRVLLMVDDLPFLQGDAGFPNWRDIPVENIEQIEVLKGAASALYGSSALNGIINIRTAYAKSTPVTKAAMFVGITGAPRNKNMQWWGDAWPMESGAQFAHRQKFGRLDVVIGANAYFDNAFRQGEYSRKLRGNGNLRYNISETFKVGVNFNINGGPSSSFFLWDRGQLLLEPSFTFREERPDSLAFNPLPGTMTTSRTFRYNIDPYVNFEDKFGNRHKILTRYYYIGNENANNQSNFSNQGYAEYQFLRAFEIKPKVWNLEVSAGLVGQYIHSNSQLFGNAEFDVSNLAAYTQIDQKFFDKLNITFGARYERNTIISPDSVTNPDGTKFLNPETKTVEGRPVFRFGASYQPAEYTFIRASWGQGYRFPTVAERYIATRIGGALNIKPNPTLESETGWSAEVGVKQGVKIFNWMGYVDVSGFWTQYQNMMEFNFVAGNSPFDFNFQANNIGNTMIRGAEISFIGQGKFLGTTTNILAGYTFIDPRFMSFDSLQQRLTSEPGINILKYRNRHSVKFDLESTYKKLTIGVSLVWNSRMVAIDRFFDLPGDFIELGPGIPFPYADWFGVNDYRQNNELNGWYNLGLRMAYQLSEKVKITVNVNNVTNNFYTIRPALPAAPRQFNLRLDYNF